MRRRDGVNPMNFAEVRFSAITLPPQSSEHHRNSDTSFHEGNSLRFSLLSNTFSKECSGFKISRCRLRLVTDVSPIPQDISFWADIKCSQRQPGLPIGAEWTLARLSVHFLEFLLTSSVQYTSSKLPRISPTIRHISSRANLVLEAELAQLGLRLALGHEDTREDVRV